MMKVVTLAVILLACWSCVYDDYDAQTGTDDGSGMAVELNIQTRSITSTSYSYEVGSQWENYIDIDGGDYRIYFFTYNPTEQTTGGANSTLISEFNPYDVMAVDGTTYTRYTIAGNVEDAITEYSNFKVVVLANWGDAHYPTNLVTLSEAGSTGIATTIDDICNAQTAVFDAFVQNGTATIPSSTLHIPFYGVREFSGVTWRSGWRTVLEGDVTLLRSVAKVEVVLNTDGSDIDDFDNVMLSGYNAQGYCAPEKIYLQNDYDSGYTGWNRDFVSGLHLVNDGKNDSGASSNVMNMVSTGTATWSCYVPEHDNTGEDYSFIQVTIGGDDYEIYFGNYDENGICNAYNSYGSADDRYDIFRNNLYRFTVTVNDKAFWVLVERWDDVYDNDWTFGNMTGNGEILPVGSQIVIKGSDGNDYCFTVISENREVMITNELMDESPAYYFGDVVIPETVVDMDNLVEYTVVAIDEGCFSQGEEITSITIPKTIREIGEYAFYECPYLEYVTIYCTELPTCGDNMFDSTPTLLLNVPAGYVDMYKNADQWGDFTEIKEIED